MGPAYSLNNATDIMTEIYYYGPVQGEFLKRPIKLFALKLEIIWNSYHVGLSGLLYLPRRNLPSIGIRLCRQGIPLGSSYRMGRGKRRWADSEILGKMTDFRLPTSHWSRSFRSPPTPGESGGARRATSESCVETTSAKSSLTFSRLSLTSTKPSRPADSCGAHDCRRDAPTTATQLLIKRTTWYPRFNAIEEKEIMWIVQSICFSSSSEVQKAKEITKINSHHCSSDRASLKNIQCYGI